MPTSNVTLWKVGIKPFYVIDLQECSELCPTHIAMEMQASNQPCIAIKIQSVTDMLFCIKVVDLSNIALNYL